MSMGVGNHAPPINPKEEKREECGNSPMGLTKKRYISSQLLDVWKKHSLSPQLVTSQNLRENGRKKGPDVTVHQPAAAAVESGSAVLSFSVDSFSPCRVATRTIENSGEAENGFLVPVWGCKQHQISNV